MAPKARFRQPPRGTGLSCFLSPGEWQTYDIRLIARAVTIALNGKTLIDRKKVEGLTAITIDPNEAERGRMVVQGDHGSVEFLTFTLTLLERAGAKERGLSRLMGLPL